MTAAPKPRRPFGVILALLGGVFLFSIVPLLMVMVLVYLSTYINNDPTGGTSGIDFSNISYQPLLLPCLAAVTYLGVAVWAWRGKREVARFVFPLMTALYAIITWGLVTLPSGQEAQGFDSATELSEFALQIYILAMIGVTLYITWFMNRWSARAFYRGYYTKTDLKLIQDSQAAS